MNQCKECRAWVFDFEASKHKCKPEYWVRCVGDTDDEWLYVRAIDPEDAAEKWAEDYDQDDHAIASGETPTVEVKSPDGTFTRWEVSGEVVAQYSAREVVTP